MSYNQFGADNAGEKLQALRSAIDRVIEDRGNTSRIERDVKAKHGDEEQKVHTVQIFALVSATSAQDDLVSEIEKTTKLARETAHAVGYKVSAIRTARDRRACREFDIW